MNYEEEIYERMCVQCLNEKYCHETADYCDDFLEAVELAQLIEIKSKAEV